MAASLRSIEIPSPPKGWQAPGQPTLAKLMVDRYEHQRQVRAAREVDRLIVKS